MNKNDEIGPLIDRFLPRFTSRFCGRWRSKPRRPVGHGWPPRHACARPMTKRGRSFDVTGRSLEAESS
jgi:hypothetical protein